MAFTPGGTSGNVNPKDDDDNDANDGGHADPKPRPKPPRPRPQKPEGLDRRIRNLEAIESGVFTGNTLASFMALPGLVGFWPMSSVQRSTGNAYDLSGQGRTLTYNGNPAYTYYNGLMPYIDLDGVGDFFSRADETDLDILGNESIYTSGAAGLTMGGWWWMDVLGTGGTPCAFISKWGGSNQSYMLDYADGFRALFSSDGSAITSTTTVTIAAGEWYFAAARFTPSSEVAVFANTYKAANTTSIPATLFNSTAPLNIGAFGSTSNLLNGRAALVFLCANSLSDQLITSLYQQSRVLFGL